MTMRECYQAVGERALERQSDWSVTYQMTSYGGARCNVYVANAPPYGHFSGDTWEEAISRLDRAIEGKTESQSPPDEEEGFIEGLGAVEVVG